MILGPALLMRYSVPVERGTVLKCVSEPERRNGSTRVPGHAFLAHDGVLCTFGDRSAPDRDKGCGPSGQAAWTVQSRTESHPFGSLSSS
jgi:hypothetical protein